MANGRRQRQDITRETFQTASPDSRQLMLFDMINDLYHQSCKQSEFCEQRKLECEKTFAYKSQTIKSRIWTVVGGIIGGILFWGTVIGFKLGL